MIRVLIFFLFFVTFLESKELQKVYFVHSNEIPLSVITKDRQNDAVIFHIQRNRYELRVPTKRVLKVLQQYGYNYFTKRYSYVTFIKKSPIDTNSLAEKLKDYFYQHYKSISINQITIINKQYLEQLPKEYAIRFQKNTLLHSHGNFSIITPQKHQIFFEYYIQAKIAVYVAKKSIKKNEKLSLTNTKKQIVVFDRFRAMPLQDLTNKEAKYHIRTGKILTLRDVVPLSLVKRGNEVNVILKDSALEIDMIAKALQGGSLNDIILIQTPRGKKLRAKVIGNNTVEVKAIQ